jgi:hypothetical protein
MLEFIPSFRRFGVDIGLGASADPMVLGQRLARFTEPFGHNFEDRAVKSRRNILFKGRDGDTLLTPDFTAVGNQLAADKLQHGRLSHAVAADDAYAVAFFNLKRYIIQQRETTKPPAHTLHTDYGHKAILFFSQAGCLVDTM